ncbi:MAG: B12-binding domain-containing radical SAM protein [Methanomicrobiales archaeon]
MLLPTNISVLAASLAKAGISTRLFDTTLYRSEEKTFDEIKMDILQVKKFSYEGFVKTRPADQMFQDLRDLVEEYKPDLIAVTLVQDTFPLAKDLLSPLRDTGIPVIAGGIFVTLNPMEVIGAEDIDMICVGEGEDALVELCRRMQENSDITRIKNIWVKKPDGTILRNEMRDPVNLDSLPFIDFDVYADERKYRPMQGKIYMMLHVEADRGCPYDCTYCSSPELRQLYAKMGCRYYRRKTVPRLIAELEYLKKKYNPGYVDINAESFLARPAGELEEFSRLYGERIGLPFWCQSRPENISDDKIRFLKAAGCKNIQFGIEHGNEEFRRRMLRRTYTNEQVVKGIEIVEKYGIDYTINNMLGFPEETRELFFDTVELNRQFRNPTTLNAYIFTPYRGTEIYTYCVDRGYIDEKEKDPSHVRMIFGEIRMKNQPMTHDEILGLQRTFPLYARFPREMFPEIRKAERLDEEGNRAYEDLKALFYEKIYKMKY